MSKQRDINPEFHKAFSRVLTGIAHEWNRFMLALDVGTKGIEKLASFAEEAIENERKRTPEQQDPWNNASDDLMERMANGYVNIGKNEYTDVVITFRFRDPNENVVTVDYEIKNDEQKMSILNAGKMSIRDENFNLARALLEIIGKRW